MSDPRKVWIDPNDCGLVTVEAAERQRREKAERRQKEEMERRQEEAEQKRRQERAMKREEERKNAARTHALTMQPKPEILPPASKVPALASPDNCAVPGLDLAEFERQIRNAAKMLNLAEPEGFLDGLIGRPDHRIDVKTERGQRLARYISACGEMMEAARKLQDTRRQAYLDHITFIRRVAEEQQNLEAVAAKARLQGQIEEAKAREIIADHEAKIREYCLRGRPAPPPLPPPPPPPAPAPVDEDTRKREEARRLRQEARKKAEEEADIALDAADAASEAAEKKVGLARSKCIRVFQNVDLRAGEKRAQIQGILDSFGFKHDILPLAVQEFVEEGYQEAEQ